MPDAAAPHFIAHRAPTTSTTARSDTSHAVRFAAVGAASTALYTLLFMALDTWMNHHAANVVALLVCTVLNTWVNQRFTFDAAGSDGARAAHVQSIAILAVTLAITTAALWIEHRVWPDAGTLLDTATVTVGNAIATLVRFFTFRRIFAN